MAQYQITLDDATVRGLLNRDEAMADLVTQVVQQILEAQVTEHLQAERYERTGARQGHRNGYRPRTIKTRVGPLTLAVPQTRDGQFSTELFHRYQRSEQALVLALLEMVVNGVSTRKVTKITEELCGTEFAKSTVSALCAQLDPLVKGWNERALTTHYPFLIVDALVVKVREDGRVRSRSTLIAAAVNEAGFREVLGLMIGDSETAASWSAFFRWLKERGLQGVDLVVSDDHGGLVQAVKRSFQGATWQRCQTHFSKNILDVTPKQFHTELHHRLRGLFAAPDPQTARTLLDQITSAFSDRAPKAMDVLEGGFDDATAVLTLPEPYRKRLRTTNGLERLNQEVRRRERVIRIFPNRDSVVRLLGAMLMELDERWTSDRRYFDMAAYWEWRAAHITPEKLSQSPAEVT